MVTKGDIVNGMFSLLRISGLTTTPEPEEIKLAIDTLDDYMAQIAITMGTGYIQPTVYGESKHSDDSGLSIELAGPVKKMLCAEFCQVYGRPVTPELGVISSQGMRAMEQLLINVDPSVMPNTLPIGSGNEYALINDKFFPNLSEVENA